MARCGESTMQSRKRSCVTADFVSDDRIAEARINFEVLVRVDQHLVHLRRETLERPCDHWFSAQFPQPLVDPTHAAALAASQHDAGDPIHRGLRPALWL